MNVLYSYTVFLLCCTLSGRTGKTLINKNSWIRIIQALAMYIYVHSILSTSVSFRHASGSELKRFDSNSLPECDLKAV